MERIMMIDRTLKLPELFGLTSKGDVKTWRVSVIPLEDGAVAIDQEYGKKDGKLQTNRKTVKVGKNIGKSSETTPLQQAIKEANSKHVKKLDEGYSLDPNELSVPLLPMLAKSFKDHKAKVEYPAFSQRKYDGVRDLCEKLNGDTVRHLSRKGKVYDTIDHLKDDLLSIMNLGDILDGELYCHHDLTFQQTISAVKRFKENSLKLEFHVYDIADPKMDFKDRYKKLQKMFAKLPKDSKVKLVETIEVDSEEEVYKLHDQWVREGYEGCIVRAKKGGYSFKHRSSTLLKYKEFIDEEFEITGGYTGKGTSFEGAVTFECKAKNGKIFGCVPKGSMEYKRHLWEGLDDLIGAKLTVRYQTLSDSGIPIFPVGIAIRDYE